MVFSSTVFTFIFLPSVLVIYYISKEKYRNNILLIASLMFYAYGEPKFIFLMLASIMANWGLALLIDKYKQDIQRRKMLLFVSVGINLLLLFTFKYLDFSITILNMMLGSSLHITGIRLPIGISFFTFQAISYIIDVYRGDGKAQKDLFKVGLYISLFPQLIAGPIVRYRTISDQIEKRETTVKAFSIGIRRFICGFCKKVILANNLALIAEKVFNGQPYSQLSVLYLWIGAISFSLQIYYDFSGYSDMAIGLGRMFGFEFEENFNYPYIAQSVTDFWRRWHISLGQWFRDYLYIPLGGSRTGAGRHIFNLFIVWAFTGLWHGANFTFIAWGLIYFIVLIVEKFLVKPERFKSAALKIIWRAVTLTVVMFAWVLFNSVGLKEGIEYWLAMIGAYHNPICNMENICVIKESLAYIIMGIIFSVPVIPWIKGKVTIDKGTERWLGIISSFIYMLGFVWAVSFLILGSHNPFIYFNF